MSFILSFNHSILLRCLWNRELMGNTMLITKVSKNNIFEFFSIITSNCNNFATFFILQFNTQFFKRIECIRFFLYEIYLSKSKIIINTYETYIFPTMLLTCIGPMRSICKQFQNFFYDNLLKHFMDPFSCLPSWQRL